MRAIVGEDPSEADIQQMYFDLATCPFFFFTSSELSLSLLLVDTNRDGVIQYAEFMNAMADWLQEDHQNRAKKRGRVDEVQRQREGEQTQRHKVTYRSDCEAVYTDDTKQKQSL